MQHVGDRLVSRRIEMICERDRLFLREIRVVVDRRIQVEQYWQFKRLTRIEELILEAEALDLVEVKSALLGEDLIDSDACDGLV